MTGGILVGHSRELLAELTALETTGKVKTINEPSLIATDSIPAVMNVGSTVPTLSSTSASGVQSGGNTSVREQYLECQHGRHPDGECARQLQRHHHHADQSAGQRAGADIGYRQHCSRPSFSNRSFQTQITVQDGDTFAHWRVHPGEPVTESSSGIPFLQRIPVLGAAFGGKIETDQPDGADRLFHAACHLRYGVARDATDDLKAGLKHMKADLKEK